MTKTKPFEIPKRLVYQAFKKIKSNSGSAGIDGVSMKDFEKDLKNNLYKIWNRMSSGTYFPPPVKRVEIPKANGGVRVLGVPTIADRIAQMVVKLSLEPKVEKYFYEDSYGYRPKKSAHDAIAVTRQRCWRNDWVLEFDIKGLFDNINHDLLEKALKKHTESKWELLYINRWLIAPFQTDKDEQVIRKTGTPQGGVISPLLANLFMHYAFDVWITRRHPQNPWARYADDGLIHCKTEEEARKLLSQLRERMNQVSLELNEGKTKIVYCKDSNRKGSYPVIEFTFLGYTYRPRKAKGKSGKEFTSFLPAISNKAKKRIRQEIKGWRLIWMTNMEIEQIAEKYNPVIRGWLNYYGKYGRKELARVMESVNQHLSNWIRRKYKGCRHKPAKARSLLRKIAQEKPDIFAHWKVGILPAG
ncbi:MAG: group II intron reverse transcriptase/maturase [Clostridiales bacterium]|nr:group II intron reverse transcriptase/maturase [Clostridiales bacterium]